MLADKYRDIIVEALKKYEETRQEKIALDVIGRAVRSNLIEPGHYDDCLLYTSPSPRDGLLSRMPSSA